MEKKTFKTLLLGVSLSVFFLTCVQADDTSTTSEDVSANENKYMNLYNKSRELYKTWLNINIQYQKAEEKLHEYIKSQPENPHSLWGQYFELNQALEELDNKREDIEDKFYDTHRSIIPLQIQYHKEQKRASQLSGTELQTSKEKSDQIKAQLTEAYKTLSSLDSQLEELNATIEAKEKELEDVSTKIRQQQDENKEGIPAEEKEATDLLKKLIAAEEEYDKVFKQLEEELHSLESSD